MWFIRREMAPNELVDCNEAFFMRQKRKNNLNRWRDVKTSAKGCKTWGKVSTTHRDERGGGGVNFGRKRAASRATQFMNEP